MVNLLTSELVRRQGPWRYLTHVELALCEWASGHPAAAQLVFLHPAGWPSSSSSTLLTTPTRQLPDRDTPQPAHDLHTT